MDQILERTTGLDQLERKTVVYYTLATHCIEHVSTFPMLVLIGPMGTGKSQTLLVVNAFAYRPHSFSLRGRTLPTIRDALGACHEGTAIIEESDRAWKGSEAFEAILSDRYQRATAQAALKEKDGERYSTTEVIYFGAMVLHRRMPFGDAALDGRSIFVHYRPSHSRTYAQFTDDDPLVVEGRQLTKDLTFEPPEVAPLAAVAGRTFDTYKLVLAIAQICEDKPFVELMAERLQLDTTQLKEAQSAEPAAMVLQALIECLSTGRKLVFRYVRIRDIRASLWNNQHIEMTPHQVAAIARQLGLETKNSHGVTVVVADRAKLVWACDALGYEDEAIAALKKQILGDKGGKAGGGTRSGREPGDDG